MQLQPKKQEDLKTTRFQMLLSPQDKTMLRTVANNLNTSMNELLTECFYSKCAPEINKLRQNENFQKF